MGKGVAALERRERRLTELRRSGQYENVKHALLQVWQEGKRPDPVRLRAEFLLGAKDGRGQRDPAPMSRLLNPRGIAMRFYLLAVFEAHCILDPGAEWRSSRSLDGYMGWGDFIAIDAAYDGKTGTYLRDTKQDRDLPSIRVRQIKGALRTLEDMEEQALAEVRRKKNGSHRDYGAFALMNEKGRGKVPTPHLYSVPKPSERTVDIPRDFFLHGWVQVLYPSEIATWLTLRFLRKRFPGQHDESGVYLYGQRREQAFHLRRDAYEDGCSMLLDLGLIRRAQRVTDSPAVDSDDTDPSAWGLADDLGFLDFASIDVDAPRRYEPHRYQLTDEGLREDGLEKTLKELVIKRSNR